jgi:hypothetical protein
MGPLYARWGRLSTDPQEYTVFLVRWTPRRVPGFSPGRILLGILAVKYYADDGDQLLDIDIQRSLMIVKAEPETDGSILARFGPNVSSRMQYLGKRRLRKVLSVTYHITGRVVRWRGLRCQTVDRFRGRKVALGRRMYFLP